jgi:cyclin H
LIKATAVQFLKRFYLTNSPMTYHPKQMMPSAIYLATKTENYYVSVKDFAEKLPKTTTDDIIAPEFLLTQGLRFTFDVRHPYRALEGGTMELHEMALGSYKPPQGSKLAAAEVKAQMLALSGPSPDRPGSRTVEELKDRIERARAKAGELLKTSALLTDAYFVYTPSQIWLGAALAADEPLILFYLHVLLSGISDASNEPSALELKILGVLRSCSATLTSPANRKPDDAEKKELLRIDKKLWKCRNPEKVDLVGMDKAAKSGHAEDGDEKIIKKRKLERDRAIKEEAELFGGSITR